MKTSLPVESLPKSLSIMNADQIKAQGLKSVGDVIDYTPGVINSQGEGHRDAAVIRGMRTTQDFYRDGVRDDVQYYRPLYNIEQVEIIRGPDALLSGFGGAYGLINRVSKQGKIGEDFLTLSGNIDTFGETSVQLDKNFNLNDSSAFRVNMFMDNLENHRDFYYGDSFGINPVVNYDLGDGSTLHLSYEYLDQERFIDRGIPTNNGRPVEALKDIVFGDATENFSTHEAHIFRAIFEHDIADSLNGRLAVSHSSHDKLYQNLYVADEGYDHDEKTAKLDGYRDTTKRSTGILSYDVSGEFETGSLVHNIIAGVQFQDTDNDNDRYNTVFEPNNNFDKDTAIFNIARPINISGGYGEDQNGSVYNQGYEGANSDLADRTFADVHVFSFYINDEVSLTDSLSLLLGVRFDNMKFDLIDAKDSANSADDTDFTTSPRVGLTFDLTEEAMLYGAYSETFAPKSGDQYASLTFKDSTGDKIKDRASSLDPDSFENIEFGVKYDLPIGLTLNAAYFEIQANKPQDDGVGGSEMIESETNGFEVSLNGSLSDKWYLSAGYTNLDAQSSSGSRLKEAPENVFSIWNNYLVSDRLAVNLGIIYQDESYLKSTSAGSPVLPDYTRVDVGANYALTDNTTLGLNIENLTDELYFPHSHSEHQASVGAPINAMLSITSKF
jgi:catecholate siderophore receptor